MKKVKIVYLRVISCTCRTDNVTVSIFVMCINRSENWFKAGLVELWHNFVFKSFFWYNMKYRVYFHIKSIETSLEGISV